MKRNKTKLVDTIVSLLREHGQARFDFGTFKIFRREGHAILLRNGKYKELAPYNVVFFRTSKTLRKMIKEWK